MIMINCIIIIEEDFSGLSEEERNKKDIKLRSENAKQRGNTEYKNKNFEAAISAFDEAVEIDPSNILAMNNKAAGMLFF